MEVIWYVRSMRAVRLRSYPLRSIGLLPERNGMDPHPPGIDLE